VLTFQRRTGTQGVAVVINFGASEAQVSLAGLPANAPLQAAYPTGSAGIGSDAAGQARLTLPAQSLRVYTFAR